VDFLPEVLPRLWQGALVTLQLTFMGGGVALVLALGAGTARLSRRRSVRFVAGLYIEVFRGTSLIVQVFFFYYVLPLLGVRWSPIASGVAALGLCAGAYGAEIVRGAVLAVDRGQHEAALSLNMRPLTTLRRIIVPQAFVAMIPPLGNLLIEILKGTSLLSLITISDLTFEATTYVGSHGHRDEVYLVVLIGYFILAYSLTLLIRVGERRLTRRLHLGPAR
jgi:polar amino acid transport system permease protein